jgi:hypothetical protein
MQFEWDEKKNQINRHKHGIWFEEAQTVFEDDYARVFFDESHSSHEKRFLIIGMSRFNNLIIVIHCYRENDDVVRIISARKAANKERLIYEEGI